MDQTLMDQTLLWSPLAAPLLACVLAVILGWRRPVAWVPLGAAVIILLCGCGLGVRVLATGPITGAGQQLRVDALTAFMLIVIGAVAVVATWAGVDYINGELDDDHTTTGAARQFVILVPLFLVAMVLAVLANNVGVMWAAVEATTVITAFLVGQHRTRASLEATWKYMIVGSVGVALAFFGTVLIYFAATHTGGAPIGLTWPELVSAAPQLDPAVTRIAAGLLLLGFGTKAGLAPMHTWLPDAHSQAPAPVSALMSGALLSVAFYALLRYRVIIDAAAGTNYLRTLFMIAALTSLLVAASLMITQRDYKRLLAYSSIEHMGIIALAAAIGGPLASAALLLHMLGHGLTKSVLFSASGTLLRQEGTTQIKAVRGVLARYPVLGVCLAVGLVSLVGFPPFSIFASELAVMRAGLDGALALPTIIAFALLLVVFGALTVHGGSILLGPPSPLPPAPPSNGPTAAPTGRRRAAAPLIVGLVAVAALGVTLGPLEPLLLAAAAVTTAGMP